MTSHFVPRSRRSACTQGLFGARGRLTASVQEVVECTNSTAYVLGNWTQLYNTNGDILVSGMGYATKTMISIARVSGLRIGPPLPLLQSKRAAVFQVKHGTVRKIS